MQLRSAEQLDKIAAALLRLAEGDTPKDEIETEVAPLLERLSAEVRLIESEADSIEAEMEGLKVKTGQNATGTGDFERIEDGVRKLRRIAALFTQDEEDFGLSACNRWISV
ncbi:unnamed protein product [Rhizoctonia solani]|uniref:Uncharacterized protein n=1 Tax=Rhizoctonia solani TaxID=456999 RepID=A0A8H3D0L5_9AGAM|nr:unnamed protein product [Rhizoctonia solani]